MAFMNNGIYGETKGRIGDTVNYRLKNKTVVRIIGETAKPPTKNQLIVRMGMTVTVKFLKAISPFINVGFELEANKFGMYAQNKAISYNKTMALMGEYPDIEIDYPKVLVSMGNLRGLADLSTELTPNGIKFKWDPQHWMGWPRCNDQTMLLAFFPDINPLEGSRNAYYVLSGDRRLVGNDFLIIPFELITQRMEIYVSVISDDRKSISNSQYLGRFN